MKKIYKHVVQVTILSEEENLDKLLGNEWDLEEVNCAITSGDCIGSVSHESTDLVPDDQVEQELIKLGNDGCFFDVGENEYE